MHDDSRCSRMSSLNEGRHFEQLAEAISTSTSPGRHIIFPVIMSHTKIPDSPEVGSVWFDDGNLIVIAGHKVFRLYRGLLTRYSPVIKNLLSPSGANTVIDEADHRLLATIGRDINTTGCAVVHFKDKPQEVEWFLSAFIGHRHDC